MRKITSLVVAMLVTMWSIGQENIFEQLEKHKGEEYQKYKIFYDVDKKELQFHDRFGSDSPKYPNSVIFIQKNKYGIPLDFEIQTVSQNNAPKKFMESFRRTTYDHYREPSIIGSNIKNKSTFVAVDGIVFEIEEAKADMSSYGKKYGYGYAFVPMSIVNKKSDTKKGFPKKKKKGGFLKKLKAKVNSMMVQKAPEPLNSMKTRDDFENFINSYLKSMKEKQRNSPLSAKDKKEEQEMKFQADQERQKINNQSAEYWKKKAEEERKNKGSKNGKVYIIKNMSGKQIMIGGNGYSRRVDHGSTLKVDCGRPIYYKRLVGSSRENGAMISDGKNVCGKTITVN